MLAFLSRYYTASSSNLSVSLLIRLRLLVAASNLRSSLSPSFNGFGAFSTRSTQTSLNDYNPNWSNCTPKETIMLDGCDFELVVLEKANESATCDEIIQTYIKTLAQIVGSYDNKDVALTGGCMLRECIKSPKLAKYILESVCFQLFFKYVELPIFDVASDAFSTFKDLLTRHMKEVSEYLTAHYDEFFDMYEKLLISPNYVTRRQSLKLLADFLLEPPNSRIMKWFILEILKLHLHRRW